MEYDITASIVVYKNNPIILQKAINSFLSTNLYLKLYIIDNSPTDKIKDICINNKTEYIFNNNNIGFGAGHNLILQNHFKIGKYHLILNPDVYFQKEVLIELFLYLEKYSKIGMIIPKVLNPDGTIQYLPKLLPTPFNVILRWLPSNFKIQKIYNRKYELRDYNDSKPISVPIISGCFSLVRSEIIKTFRFYYDNRFFMYFEDFDFARRIGQKSKTVYYPSVQIYHDYGRGAYKNFSLFRIYISSFVRYFNKWGWFLDSKRKSINKSILKNLD